MVDSLFLVIEFAGFGLLLFEVRHALREGKTHSLGFFSFKEKLASTKQ